jgi:ribonuclease HI
LTDLVTQIAEAIAKLEPADRRRLFALLAARGVLPDEPLASATFASQTELLPAEPTGDWAPDYVLVFDGGSRGNPGWGYGSYAITRTADRAKRLERLDLGDGYTNNEAEYDTLIAALGDLIARIEEAGRQPGEFRLEVRGDSALAINQIDGRWKAKEPRMRERRDRCRRLVGRFGGVVLKTQPREESVHVLGH